MPTSPILTNIVRRGVVPALKPLQPDMIEQEDLIPQVASTTANQSEQLNLDDLEKIIDGRLQQLKKDLMHDITKAMQIKT